MAQHQLMVNGLQSIFAHMAFWPAVLTPMILDYCISITGLSGDYNRAFNLKAMEKQ
jgi:hypothetical protein